MIKLEIITIVKDDVIAFERTQKSIVAQNSKDFSWLVVDGSSSNDIRRNLNPSACKRVRYIFRNPKGIYNAMNEGIAFSEGIWVWYLNAGDVLANSESIDIVSKVIANNPNASAFGFTVHHVDASGYLWDTSVPHISTIKGTGFLCAHINHQGFIARREEILKFGKFDENLAFVADSKLMDSFAHHRKIICIDKHIVNFIVGGHSNQNFSEVFNELGEIRPYSKNLLSYFLKLKLISKNRIRMYVSENLNLLSRILKRLRQLKHFL
jgi:glycosyltransferase involved in cell wall biosynthesis